MPNRNGLFLLYAAVHAACHLQSADYGLIRPDGFGNFARFFTA